MDNNKDLSSAYKYLETIQGAFFKLQGIKPIVYDKAWLSILKNKAEQGNFNKSMKHLSEMLKQQIPHYEKLIEIAPTKYTSPINLEKLLRLKALIEYAANNVLKKDLKERYHTLIMNNFPNYSKSPFFFVNNNNVKQGFILSTLPFGQFNARIQQYRKENIFYILFDDEIFNFLNLISKCIVPFMKPFEDSGLANNNYFDNLMRIVNEKVAVLNPESVYLFKDNIKELVISSKEVQNNLFQYITIYLLYKHIGGLVKPIVLEKGLQIRAQQILDLAELFLIGHEYSHGILNHINSESSTKENNEVDRSWNQEYEADQLGLDLSSEASRFAGLKLKHHASTFIGGYFFLLCAELIEKGASMLITGTSTENSYDIGKHPPAINRIKNLDKWINKEFKDHHHLEIINKNISDIKLIFETFWDSLEPKLEEMFLQGKRPWFFKKD